MEPLSGRDGITAEWLTEALRESGRLPRGRVREVELSTKGIGFGYISETVRVIPTYEGADAPAPASLVAKIPVSVDFPAYLRPWAAQAVETELHFYPQAGGDLRSAGAGLLRGGARGVAVVRAAAGGPEQA